jgi:hypothetical protein
LCPVADFAISRVEPSAIIPVLGLETLNSKQQVLTWDHHIVNLLPFTVLVGLSPSTVFHKLFSPVAHPNFSKTHAAHHKISPHEKGVRNYPWP